ncbi:MAG: hypothetical protein NXI02_11980 [Rhodobacteraceae bacterium]|nr:hypothetical protein [Paracoccaceae bacterium]
MKLGVICDGISRDLKHALTVMDEFGLDYAELQFASAAMSSLTDASVNPGSAG